MTPARPPSRLRGLIQPLAALTALQLGAASCANIRPVVADTTNREVARRERRLPNDRTLLQTSVEGTELRFAVKPSCALVAFTSMLEVKRIEYEADGVGNDVLAGILAAAAIGTGVGLLVDAANVGSSATDARVFNESGADAATYGGYAALAGGAALLTIPVVDMIRAARSETEKRPFEVKGDTLTQDVVCEDTGARSTPPGWSAVPKGASDLTITTRGGLERMSFSAKIAPGRTQNADLAAIVDADKFARGERRPSHLEVALDGVSLVTVPAEPVLASIDRQRKRGLAKAIMACEKPEAVESCDAIKRELSDYPATAYARELRDLLNKSEPALVALRDAKDWARSYVDDCLAPDEENDCEAVEAYLNDWPQGRFAAEAKKALAKGLPKVRQMIAKREAAERAEEARERAEEAREEARERAEERQQEAKEVREFCTAAHESFSCNFGCCMRVCGGGKLDGGNCILEANCGCD
jgi:hypothetical protein